MANELYAINEPDSRKYIAYRFMAIASMLHNAKNFIMVYEITTAAVSFDSDKDIMLAHNDARKSAALHQALLDLDDVSGICDSVKTLARCVTLKYFGITPDNDAWISHNIDAWLNNESHLITSLINKLRQRFPELYVTFSSLFGGLLASVSRQESPQPSGCFVVTATYGSPYAAEVEHFRMFRDQVLRHHLLGRAFIRVYWWIGPIAASAIRHSPLLRRISARFLGWLARRLP